MPMVNGSVISCLIPRCFRRDKTPPDSKSTGNIFEERMKQRLQKQRKRPARPKYAQTHTVDEEFATFDLLAAIDRSVAAKYANRIRKVQWPHLLSWDSVADTYVSPPSSVGAEAGGDIAPRQTTDYDPEILSRSSAQFTRQELSQEAVFRLQQLGHLDMRNSVSSFVYQAPRESARKWSTATTNGSDSLCSVVHGSYISKDKTNSSNTLGIVSLAQWR
ncbi:hypothetical protein PF010_g13754 [Phytophthora fragariae]|uniref:Uncharacterized protein n=1 Tax=Phytophthora fragariae TaxID=53985 RepID=A0A6A3K1M2_9STRA|nr:hypothetical protein PF003_g24064 [Phytophthora fragariae]KAE9000991.1 hypothetical protein PF011_g13945 [Phytophthora fragariae]KAE9103382.1 hypothetical protein PF010_g13754 [Phytophthora fragariae]